MSKQFTQFSFGQFKDCAFRNHYLNALPKHLADALVEDVFLQITNGTLKSKHPFTTGLRRIQDRAINLLNGERVTLKFLDEVLFLERVYSLESIDDWLIPRCDIDYFIPRESKHVTTKTLARAMASLSSQQSRHYNKVAKELLPLLAPDTQKFYLESYALCLKMREQKRHNHGK